jgi:hypothetical protein
MNNAQIVSNVLSSLPMHELISTPLLAACEAQEKLANATASFITNVGLQAKRTDGGDAGDGDEVGQYEARTVDFTYKDGTKTKSISAPLLAIVNIPSLSIQDVNINFECKVDAMQQDTKSTEAMNSTETDARFSVSARYWAVKAKFSYSRKTMATLTTKTNSLTQNRAQATYTVNVSARNERPEGLMKILDILQQVVQSNNVEPTPAPAGP